MGVVMDLKCIGISALVLGMASCASAPKQTCSAEWIQYEVDDIYADLRKDTKSELNNFKEITAALEDPEKAASPWLAFRLVGLVKDVREVVETYAEIYQPRLQTIADTCDEPELVVNALGEFLEQEGAPPDVIELLQDFSELVVEKQSDEEV